MPQDFTYSYNYMLKGGRPANLHPTFHQLNQCTMCVINTRGIKINVFVMYFNYNCNHKMPLKGYKKTPFLHVRGQEF